MRLILITIIGLLTACAGMSYRPLAPEADKTDTGIRYYRSAPYLLVYTDGRGGLETKILHLPDRTQLMSAKGYARGAKLDSTLKLSNGVLTDSTDTVDITGLPKSVIGALQNVATKLLAANQATTLDAPAPYLYRIVYQDGTLRFYGKQGDTGIKVKVKPKKKEAGS